MNIVDQVGIYNMALAAVGVSQFVQSPTEGSLQANTLSIFWESCRDQCLQDYQWGFANRNAVLEALTIGPPPHWLYIFGYPSDCLQARRIVHTPDSGNLTTFNIPGYSSYSGTFCSFYFDHRHIPFELVEDEAEGGIAIATNEQYPTLVYTARITTLSLWSPAFVNALVWLLATKICVPFSANPKYATEAGQAYEAAIRKAGAASMNEGEERQRESELIHVRG